MSQGTHRRLAAIISADVVGYSRLLGEDSAGTLAALRQLRSELLAPAIDHHHGQIVKSMGDGWLVEFTSVADAVNCALEVQQNLAEHESIKLRIGVHLGDITYEEEDIYGDGINIAARLQEIAEPGGVVISDMARRSIDGKLAASFVDIGLQELKNIAEPVSAHGWGMTAVVSEPAALPSSDKLSIAVLPFSNRSDDSEQTYFSDGMTEDLIVDLAKIAGLTVAARNASFAFRERMPDAREVGEMLGVSYVLEGSVRKRGAQLRINTQLIDTISGRHVWAERYDGDLESIFEFQDQITAEIVAALKLKLTAPDPTGGGRRRTANIDAYDSYLKGRQLYFRYTPDDNIRAKESLEQALSYDPDFADAHSYLSCCYTNAWIFLWPGFDEGLSRGLEFAERGVELTPDSAIAMTRLAWIQLFLRDHDQAFSNFDKARALDDASAEVRALHGEALNFGGNPRAAVALLESAFQLDPFCPPSWLFILGHAHFLLRHYEDARRLIQQAIERLPDFQVARLFFACLLVETDSVGAAEEQIKTVLSAVPHYTLADADRVYPYRQDRDRRRFLDGLRRAGLPA